MPAPGDQYRDNAATVNPFVQPSTHVTPYTAKDIATLQSRLDKQLGPEYISTRPGNGGGKVHYLAAEKVINLANEVFGFNGWNSSIQNVQVDFVDENPTNGKINLGLSAIVRVTLKDGTFHEDVGYGHCENTKGKAAAFEKAKKEAATDALKRALRTFGNVLGNCLYDKDYLQKVTKVKVAASRWDAGNLHRHPDYAPTKKESMAEGGLTNDQSSTVRRNASAQSTGSSGSIEFEDDFGGNFLDEPDFSHPDEVCLDDTRSNMAAPVIQTASNGQRQGASRPQSIPQSALGSAQPSAPSAAHFQPPQRPPAMKRPPLSAGQPQPRNVQLQTPGHQQRPQVPNTIENNQANGAHGTTVGHRSEQDSQASKPGVAKPDEHDGIDNAPRQPPPGNPVGFITGRTAELLSQPLESRPPNAVVAFNPHLESPSIRRTHGINPGKSVPISRQQVTGNSGAIDQHAQPGGSTTVSALATGLNGSPRPSTTNFVNPSADPNRRIGTPQMIGQAGGPNRNAYRPPSTVKRPALADVSNIKQVDAGPDPKKTKIDVAVTEEGGQEATGTEAAAT